MATQTQQARQQPAPRKRVIHQLETPFTTVAWPEITPQDQATILELLCSLLAPIGQHRQNHTKRSKGKRAKRKAAKSEAAAETTDALVPPEPPIASHVDVGFNSITKTLQAASTRQTNGSNTEPQKQEQTPKRYSIIFVARGDQSPAFNCHFPQMVGAATRSQPEGEKTRLVGFSRACSEKLSLALGIPRVSSLAIGEDAPGAEALQELVRTSVPAVEVPWLPSSQTETYRQTKINSMETTVGNKKTRVV